MNSESTCVAWCPYRPTLNRTGAHMFPPQAHVWNTLCALNVKTNNITPNLNIKTYVIISYTPTLLHFQFIIIAT